MYADLTSYHYFHINEPDNRTIIKLTDSRLTVAFFIHTFHFIALPVIQQINLFNTEEFKLSAECYKMYGLCEECDQLNTGHLWCQSCNAKCFLQNFNKWT